MQLGNDKMRIPHRRSAPWRSSHAPPWDKKRQVLGEEELLGNATTTTIDGEEANIVQSTETPGEVGGSLANTIVASATSTKEALYHQAKAAVSWPILVIPAMKKAIGQHHR